MFNETILNIFRHYVANKYITCDDKDPVWMNENIKSKRKSKKLIYKQYTQNGRKESDLIVLENLITETSDFNQFYQGIVLRTLEKS